LQEYDPLYFEKVSSLLYHYIEEAGDFEEQARQYLSFSLRLLLSQATESLLALIAAALQAPDCVYGWLYKYRNSQLREIVEKINNGSPLRNRLSLNPVTWDSITKRMLAVDFKDEEKGKRVCDEFSLFWTRLARDFLSEEYSCVYNSMKHGFRASPGGMYIAIGKEDIPGEASKSMHSLGGSKYGATYLYPDPKISRDRTLRLLSKTVNWSPKGIWFQIALIRFSINNVLSFLKVINGVDPETVQFMWPDNLDDFKRDLETSPKALSFTMNQEISSNIIRYFTKEEMLTKFDNAHPQN